ncbi:ABC transporter substrate-binding protein [Amorphus orientalis]|uniref:Spermidine/putrescine transport system substrate-binding protein n=1 Tax=Amorphus orientalis TaxID=649198 RepID=A0AAE3VLD2_9HYPH|nr:extracellular solute-binding protein [Amorphus orientalis]MDQ0314122.1 spermidine/putrescine transport system substrate-binding protein [Amorphus orientalis]
MKTAMRTSLLALGVSAVALVAGQAQAQDQLNALVWCDHTDRELIQPFEEEHNVRVNLKEYEGTGTALSLIEQSQPGDWDVLVVDGIDVPRVVEAGILGELPADIAPDSIFPEVALDSQQVLDGKRYAVTEKFGYNTVSFNQAEVDPSVMADMTNLWSDGDLEGKLAVYDYYLPVMGMVAMGLGKKTADLSEADLPDIRDALFKLKDNAALVGGVVASQTALATGEVDVLVGGGEWVTAGLSAENPDLEWILPEQGGVMWSQSIGVFADSERKDLATEFVKYILSPEAQAKLATSSCYWAMPANEAAGDHLSEQQKKALRWDDQGEYLQNVQLYPAPDAELDAKMQDVWAEFLQH